MKQLELFGTIEAISREELFSSSFVSTKIAFIHSLFFIFVVLKSQQLVIEEHRVNAGRHDRFSLALGLRFS